MNSWRVWKYYEESCHKNYAALTFWRIYARPHFLLSCPSVCPMSTIMAQPTTKGRSQMFLQLQWRFSTSWVGFHQELIDVECTRSPKRWTARAITRIWHKWRIPSDHMFFFATHDDAISVVVVIFNWWWFFCGGGGETWWLAAKNILNGKKQRSLRGHQRVNDDDNYGLSRCWWWWWWWLR